MLIQDFLGCRSGSACSPGSGGAVSAEALGESRRLAPGPSEEESPQRLPPGSAVSRPEGAKGSGHFLSLARRIYRCGWTQVDRPLPVYGCGWTPDGQDPPCLRLWVGGPEVDIKQSLSSQLSCRAWSLPDLTCDPAEGFHHPGYSRLVNAHSMTPGDPWNPPPPLHPSS